MAPQPKILIIDDEPYIREVYREALTRIAALVSEARNGKEALLLLQREPDFDVIILDIKMPIMDGFTFRTLQLANELLSRIPVIFATGIDVSAVEMKMIGDSPVIYKPINMKKFLDLVKSVVEKNHE